MNEVEIDRLAQEIHLRYRKHWKAEDGSADHPMSVKEWGDLTVAEQETNRAQARDITTKLALLGCYVVANDDGNSRRLVLEDSQIELLAVDEHKRWMRQKVEAGWSLGTPRDDARKIHPMIVPWAQLTPEQQELDRQPIRNIPDFLEMLGFGVEVADAQT